MKKLLVILVLYISFFNISYAEEIVNLSKDTSSGYKKFFKSVLLTFKQKIKNTSLTLTTLMTKHLLLTVYVTNRLHLL